MTDEIETLIDALSGIPPGRPRVKMGVCIVANAKTRDAVSTGDWVFRKKGSNDQWKRRRSWLQNSRRFSPDFEYGRAQETVFAGDWLSVLIAPDEVPFNVVRAVAGESIASGDIFYLAENGKAHKLDSGHEPYGVALDTVTVGDTFAVGRLPT